MKTVAIVPIILLAATFSLAQTTRPSSSPATRPAAGQPTADQVMDNLLRPAAGQTRPLQDPPTGVSADKTSGKGAVPPRAPAVQLRREGTYIVDRVGRLGRTPDGLQPQFIFESDGKTLKDPPMIILPNAKLTTMEDVVTGPSARDFKFRVSGVITEYRGRNYLLLEKLQVISDSVSQF